MSKTKLPEGFGTEPLHDERYERFSQLRVMGVACGKAAEACFRTKAGKPVLPGNAARYDRHPEVRARKTYLAGHETDVIREARQLVSDRLMAAMQFDPLKDFAILGSIELDGKKVPRVVGLDWEALKVSEHSVVVTGFKFDRETGVMTEFTCDDALQAIAQYRDMYGLRAPRRKEISGRDGGPIKTQDLSAYTDEELAVLETIQAAAAARSSAAASAPGGD